MSPCSRRLPGVRTSVEHVEGDVMSRSLEDHGEPRELDTRSLGMVGSCAPILEVYQMVARVAPTNSTVLVQGETGTGKELIARAVHAASRRSDRPFVPVDCSTLAE